MTKECTGQPICGVDYAFRRIGGKYKGRILLYLHNHTIMRYGELREVLADITPKMQTQTLRELEKDKLVLRQVYHQVPAKVEYSLTDVGVELIPFIDQLREWGEGQIRNES